jgi:hypothetical protein
MRRYAVDTNVARVANWPHDPTHASPECVLRCVTRIRDIMARGGILLDDAWHIVGEYQNQLRSLGQPGVGDAFLKAVLTRRNDPSWCIQVPVTPHPQHGFAEFPTDPDLVGFDPSDRKFVAVVLAGPPGGSVLNAVDRDWWDHREALERNGVEIEFLCPDQMTR